MIPRRTYSESVSTVTWHARLSARSPSIAAASSIRLLVASGTPPCSTRSCSPHRRMHAQPPGPGFPRHEPSMIISTSLSSQRKRWTHNTSFPGHVSFSVHWSERIGAKHVSPPRSYALDFDELSQRLGTNQRLDIDHRDRFSPFSGLVHMPQRRLAHHRQAKATTPGLNAIRRLRSALPRATVAITRNSISRATWRASPRQLLLRTASRSEYFGGAALRTERTATCASAAPPTHNTAGVFNPNPSSTDDGEGNRAPKSFALRGLADYSVMHKSANAAGKVTAKALLHALRPTARL